MNFTHGILQCWKGEGRSTISYEKWAKGIWILQEIPAEYNKKGKNQR